MDNSWLSFRLNWSNYVDRVFVRSKPAIASIVFTRFLFLLNVYSMYE